MCNYACTCTSGLKCVAEIKLTYYSDHWTDECERTLHTSTQALAPSRGGSPAGWQGAGAVAMVKRFPRGLAGARAVEQLIQFHSRRPAQSTQQVGRAHIIFCHFITTFSYLFVSPFRVLNCAAATTTGASADFGRLKRLLKVS